MVGPSIKTNNITLKPCSTTMIKFLCSCGGKILPRYPDGKLRYHGGETRVLAVERSISFTELLVKLEEMCGKSVSLRCQLPTEDLDALVSITSDEDLANLIEEYNSGAAAPPAPIRITAFLFASKSTKKFSPTPSISAALSSSNDDATPPKSKHCIKATAASIISSRSRCTTAMARPSVFPLCYGKAAGKLPQCAYHGHGKTSSRRVYLIHNGYHWQ